MDGVVGKYDGMDWTDIPVLIYMNHNRYTEQHAEDDGSNFVGGVVPITSRSCGNKDGFISVNRPLTLRDGMRVDDGMNGCA